MIKQRINIQNIPAILWGSKSDKIFVAVHGNMSNKEDAIIIAFAETAVANNYQVISFDLPEHGERVNSSILCNAQNCVQDLETVMHYTKSLSNSISLFACSMGAYFSLLSYKNEDLQQSIFLSPVVDMMHLIHGMMEKLHISEEKLKREKTIETPFGQTLYWEYYCYVKSHPLDIWNTPTAILLGAADSLCDFKTVSLFSKKFNCDLQVMENGEHYFHTQEQLDYFKRWIKRTL